MSQSCPNCGTLNLDSYRFCSNCGSPLGSAAQAAPPSATDPTISSGSPPPDTIAQHPASYGPPPSTPFSYEPPPSAPPPAPASQESNFTPPPPTSNEPAYIVKTSPDAVSFGSPASAAPTNAFEPPSIPPPPSSVPGAPASDPQATAMQSRPAQYTGYQAYDPNASGRKEGGVYTPYAQGTATSIEKVKEPRSWLIPVIVIAALLLVGLAVIGFLAGQQNKGPAAGNNNTPVAGIGAQASPAPTTQSGNSGSSGSPVKPPAVTATELPASASEEDKIKAVIVRSNEQQIRAWRELNTDILSENYTGNALIENKQEVQQLIQLNLYAIPEMLNLKISDDIKIAGSGDSPTATAHTVETWRVTYYDKATNTKNKTDGPTTYNEIYHLIKQKPNANQPAKWMITDLEIPTPVPVVPTRPGT